MGKSDQSQGKHRINLRSRPSEIQQDLWMFLGFDADYRVVQMHTLTNKIRKLEEFTILLDGSENLTYVPM